MIDIGPGLMEMFKHLITNGTWILGGWLLARFLTAVLLSHRVGR